MREYLSRIGAIIACLLFGSCTVANAKTLAPESNDRVIKSSIQRQGYIQIPGVGTVNIKDAIYPGSHFTWGEATRDGSRIPESTLFRGEWVSAEEVAQNIIAFARDLDDIRSQFGDNPIDINSWYRTEAINRATPGAADDSYHKIGLAADFRIRNWNSYRVYKILNLTWPGGLGCYEGRTHGDRRDRVGAELARW